VWNSLYFQSEKTGGAIATAGAGNVKKLRHRGPDWSGIFSCSNAILAHERLSIVDPASGKQPFVSKDGKLVLAVNGEIYNHRDIRKRYENEYEFLTLV